MISREPWRYWRTITTSPSGVIGTTFTHASASIQKKGWTSPVTGDRAMLRLTPKTLHFCSSSVSTTSHGRGFPIVGN